MILLSLALAGCHVFEAVEIDCASDEPCARPRDTDADADTDTDADTDADTDVDTGPVVGPSVGWVVSGESTAGNRVLAFSPSGGTLAAWTGLGENAGPVAYDPDTGEAYLGAGGVVWRLQADGTVSSSTAAFPYALDLAVHDGEVYVATGDNLVAWNVAGDTTTSAFSAAKAGLVALGVSPDGGVYASDTDGGAPDLYRWVAGGTPTSLYADYDETASRARIVFPGPDGTPYGCSEAGAIYPIAALAEGSSRAVAFYNGGLTDVSACAYDPANETWLIFSPSVGVVRLDAQSRAEVVFEPVSSYTLVRASFY